MKSNLKSKVQIIKETVGNIIMYALFLRFSSSIFMSRGYYTKYMFLTNYMLYIQV